MKFNISIHDNILKALNAINSKIKNPEEIISDVADDIKKGVSVAFNSEVDPTDNSPWADLIVKPKDGSRKKLQKTFKGRKSIKIHIKESSIYVSFERYMFYHLVGTNKMVERPFLPALNQRKIRKNAENTISLVIRKHTKKR